MSRPLAVDLCCGVGGWAAGLIAEGFDVVGFDLHRLDHPLLPRFPGQKVIADVRTISGTSWRGKVELITASPPCTEFSRRCMPFRHGRPELWAGEPDLSIVRACERIALEAGAPLVLENVRGAVPWLGKPAHRSGPFYLWGDGVPPLLPTIGPCKTRYYDPSAPPGTPPRNSTAPQRGSTSGSAGRGPARALARRRTVAQATDQGGVGIMGIRLTIGSLWLVVSLLFLSMPLSSWAFEWWRRVVLGAYLWARHRWSGERRCPSTAGIVLNAQQSMNGPHSSSGTAGGTQCDKDRGHRGEHRAAWIAPYAPNRPGHAWTRVVVTWP